MEEMEEMEKEKMPEENNANKMLKEKVENKIQEILVKKVLLLKM